MAESEQEENTISSLSNNHVDRADKQGEQVSVKIVLTANNHLGRDIVGQRRREERLQRLRDAFQQATSFAVSQGADLFIQAGDLFDTTTPDEQDRTFVASCLARLKQAGIPVIALGGTHDTPVPVSDESVSTSSLPPAPQRSYAQLGALHYFSPLSGDEESKPLFLDIHGLRVGIAGIGWENESNTKTEHISRNPFARVRSDVERTPLPLLILHTPIEGITTTLPRIAGRDRIALLKRDEIAQQTAFRVMLDGYSHTYSRTHIGSIEVISAGSTQSDAGDAGDDTAHREDSTPGFVYLGMTPQGVRWCNHVSVDALLARQLTISLHSLWPDSPSSTVSTQTKNPTELILAQLASCSNAETMMRLRLEGEVTRSQYHQLDLNKIRQYGEQHCFSLAIDDSSVTLLPDYPDHQEYHEHEQQHPVTMPSQERGERFSLRDEIIALADQWITDVGQDEQERRTLHHVKEDVLAAIDSITARSTR